MTISIRHIAAAILLFISLIVPLACDAAHFLDHAEYVTDTHEQTALLASDIEPPCHESPPCHLCENDCCSNYAPPDQSLLPVYSPIQGHLDQLSIDRIPLQVYFSIFVPPQNTVA